MDERKTVPVFIELNGACRDATDWGEALVTDVIAELQSALEEVEEEHQSTATVSFCSGDFGRTATVKYTRPEYDHEMTRRLEHEAKSRQFKEAEERAQLDALMKKYGVA